MGYITQFIGHYIYIKNWQTQFSEIHDSLNLSEYMNFDESTIGKVILVKTMNHPPPQKHKKTTSQKSHSIIKFHCCNKLSIQRVLDNWNWLYITYSFWMFSLFNSMYFCLPYSARNWRWRWLCCQIEGTTMVSNRIWSCQIFRR